MIRQGHHRYCDVSSLLVAHLLIWVENYSIFILFTGWYAVTTRLADFRNFHKVFSQTNQTLKITFWNAKPMIPRHEMMCAIAKVYLRLMIAICLTGWETIEIIHWIVIVLPRKSATTLADWNCSHCLIWAREKCIQKLFHDDVCWIFCKYR